MPSGQTLSRRPTSELRCSPKEETIRRYIYTFVLLVAGGLVVFFCGCDGPAPAFLLGKFPPADGGPVLTIPFQFFHEFIFITVNVNNRSSRTFLLDSATSDDEVSFRVARDMELRLGRIHAVSGDGIGEGTTDESSAKGISLFVENKELFWGKVSVVDMSAVERALNHSEDGVLGEPLFEAYVVQIDYAKHVVRLFDPRKYDIRGKRHIIPIRIDGRRPFMAGTISKMDGSLVNARLLIDTGADAPLSLNHPFDLKNGLPDAQETKPMSGAGIEGAVPDIFGHVEKLQFEKISFSNVPTFFSMAIKGQDASDKYDGTIGNYLLVNFLVTFDYPHKQIILQEPTSK